MHGNLVNFDNDIVASKAWNRLFAVADWAASRQKQSVPPKPEPTFREVLARIRENEGSEEGSCSVATAHGHGEGSGLHR